MAVPGVVPGAPAVVPGAPAVVPGAPAVVPGAPVVGPVGGAPVAGPAPAPAPVAATAAKVAKKSAAELMAESRDKFKGTLTTLFSIISSDESVTAIGPGAAIKFDDATAENPKELKFTITLPSKLNGEIGNLRRDISGKKKGLEGAVGAKITVEPEVKGSINCETGEITFEKDKINITKSGVKFNLNGINLNHNGDIVKVTVDNPTFGKKTINRETIVSAEDLKATMGVAQWKDAANTMPPITNVKSKADLEKEDKAAKLQEDQGTLDIVVRRKERKENDDEELIKFLQDSSLLGRFDYKLIGIGSSLQLEDNARSALALETKMVRGAELLQEVDFDDVTNADGEIDNMIVNLKKMRRDMFHSASSKDAKTKIWELLTATIDKLEKLKAPVVSRSCGSTITSGWRSLKKTTYNMMPRSAQRAYKFVTKNKGWFSIGVVPAGLIAARVIGFM
ncbi:MAG: hypothetical protein JSS30_04675 [Verrucomicrobia bacterium]|nr:hypothetical protein [Verrucomicrobiota bacterium]